MIPLSLLKSTESRCPGIGVYGGPGMKKTLGICTLVPPIEMHDVGEGGTACLLPWIRRRRDSTSREWINYSDEDRQSFFDLLDADTKKNLPLSKPNPFIDVIHYDVTDPTGFETYKTNILNFDYASYNSLATDSLQELSELIKTWRKGAFDASLQDVSFGWVGVQERSGQQLRVLRNLRDKGVVVYFTAAEDIAKDYVKNPMSKRDRGEAEPTPYSVKGTVQLPGQLAEAFSHVPDLLMHARLIGQNVMWITEPELLPGGGASWDAKDRYGRLSRTESPNIRLIFKKLYGPETYEKIYEYGLEMVK